MLTVTDLRSPTWKRFEQELIARLAELREDNDATYLDPIKTALIRGQISEVKRILDLGRDPSSRTEPLHDESSGLAG